MRPGGPERGRSRKPDQRPPKGARIERLQVFSRFPNAELVSRQSNYTSFPYRYRWDDAYLITDADFRTVYTWYSLQFGTGPERQANGRCILLESGQSNFLLERYNVITLCDNPQIGTRAYVQRLTSWR